jgi:hypothetical protein
MFEILGLKKPPVNERMAYKNTFILRPIKIDPDFLF